MLFLFALLFFVQELSSLNLGLDKDIWEILHQDFTAVPKKKVDKEFHFPKLEADAYLNMRYYQEIMNSTDLFSFNASVFGETWYIASINQSRTQGVVYLDGNDTGIPFEVVVVEDYSEYVIVRSGDDLVCEYEIFSSIPSSGYQYFITKFITPEFDDYSILWGPRLVDLFYLMPDTQTIYVAGLDAFTYDLVLFYVHITTSAYNFDELTIVHDVAHNTFDESNVYIPSTVDCKNTNGAEIKEETSSFSFKTYFPHALFRGD